MTTTAKAPVIFVSHGAPTFAVEPGRLGPQLARLGELSHGIESVLVVSAHWQTRGVRVMTTPAPETVHDFGGFPAELYRLRYPAPGAPEYALQAAQLLRTAGFRVDTDELRGLDHGAWVPLRYLYPRADVPVFQVSMPFDLDPAGALRLGRALAPLRERGVLIVGSGSLTHNLYEFRHGAPPRAAAYVDEFAGWVESRVIAGDTEALTNYRRLAPHAERAHPTEEHYLPLLVAMGARAAADTPVVIKGDVTYGILSMDSISWGSFLLD